VAAAPDAAAVTQETLKGLARVLWSMPPDHGAAVVRIVLEDPALRADWLAELEAVRGRMLSLRAGLAEALRARLNADAFDAVGRQRGMFSLLPVSPAQVERLRAEHGVYMVGDGRVNIAGLASTDVAKLAEALAAVEA
jgi:aromatic-amino-acid transaminase